MTSTKDELKKLNQFYIIHPELNLVNPSRRQIFANSFLVTQPKIFIVLNWHDLATVFPCYAHPHIFNVNGAVHFSVIQRLLLV